ncbi:MAG: redoxin domain-containing protein [Phycisphaeraceae bacterium]|nr:redoxin domain-containing protein [Phycisphaeraceae bacterium]
MNTRRRLFPAITLGLVALAAAAIGANAQNTGATKATAKIGQAAPAWTMVDTNGKSHSLADFKGKVVVMEWYNPGCPYVRNIYENRRVHAMISEMKKMGDNYVYLLVNSTANISRDDMVKQSTEYLRKAELDMPILVDYDGKVGRSFDARTTPHMFVIDETGVLRYHGAFSDDNTGKKADATLYVLNALRQMKAGESVSPDYVRPWGCSVKYASAN